MIEKTVNRKRAEAERTFRQGITSRDGKLKVISVVSKVSPLALEIR